jgi:CRP/FNR family transcriptional regulator
VRPDRPECLPFLERLTPAKGDLVLANASTTRHQAGSIFFQPGVSDRAAILTEGMARAFITSVDGRTASIRYIHEGELMGGLLVMEGEFGGWVQLITDVALIDLDMSNLRRLVSVDASVAEALAGDQAGRYAHTVRVVAVHVFGSVLQRVAFDLLERACGSQLETSRLEALVSQQEVADGIGSSRDVVGRAMAQLRTLGLVETRHRRVTVLDVHRLEDLAATVIG